MIHWQGKVAVITGAAGGIGKEIAKKCLNLGMKVVLTDIEEKKLRETYDEFRTMSSEVIKVETDVSKFDNIQLLAEKTMEAFEGVHFLFNNAGVADNSFVWESTPEDWHWIMGVNFYAVVHAIKVFVPLMLKQAEASYIINTASLAGLIAGNLGIYSVSKHAVVSLSETLFQSLKLMKSNIHVAVLCPGMVKTKIVESERNRPNEMKNNQPMIHLHPIIKKRMDFVKNSVEQGKDPQEIVEILFKELQEGKFYILTHKEDSQMDLIKQRMDNVLSGYFTF